MKSNNNIPLSEYPRPQLQRDSYLSLNGYWEYAIRDEENIPESFDGQILVPYSPETELSGINKIVKPTHSQLVYSATQESFRSESGEVIKYYPYVVE